ncbi:MAG: T9SS type A sorting domain-containing protein [Ignavibacteriales bacterium]|nr:MAG: T9SS type A sorting domain-containing protein [Ignavibacteriales bacterium]
MKFPYGTISSAQPDPEDEWVWSNNFDQIKALGVNFIIHRLNQDNKDIIAGEGLKVIAHNVVNENDFVNHFSAGANVTYKPVGSPPADGYTEFVQFSKGAQDGNGNWVINHTTNDTGEAISYGPNASQYHKYVPNYYDEFIQFVTLWEMKIDGDTTQDTVPVCIIRIEYKKPNGDTTVLASKILTVEDFQGNNFTSIELEYNLIGVTQYTNLIPRYSDGPDLFPSPEDEEYGDSPTLAHGVNYRLYFLDNRTLHIKSIECFDKEVWEHYMISYANRFTEKLDSQTTPYQNYQNLTHWMTIQEPHSLDQYRPIKILANALEDSNRQPPITLFYPGWNGFRNGHDSFKQYKDSVNPSQMLFYYFPFWASDVPQPYMDKLLLMFWYMGDRLFDAHRYFPGYYYSAQAQGFVDERTPTPTWRWRKPEYKELSASMLLALATGAKGLILESYYSYPGFDSYPPSFIPRCEGLVWNYRGTADVFYPTPLYDDLKDYFKPRITGALGDALVNLNFNGSMIRKRKCYYVEDENVFNFDDQIVHGTSSQRLFMSALDTSGSTNHMHHVGFFNDQIDTVNHRYFFLVNLMPKINADSVRHIRLSFKVPDTNTFRDYRLRDIEGGYDTNFRDSITIIKSINGGDGRLYQLVPTVRYGGVLSSNDTVKYIETLLEDLEIPTGKTLHVKGVYQINAHLQADSGGFITHNGLSGYTYLDTAGSYTVSNWSSALLKSRAGIRPKLIWASYPGTDSVLSYKIYRKKQDTVFSLLATVSSSVRSYIDSNTSIIEGVPIMNETFADYYVTVTVLLPGGRNQTASHNSNTVDYNRVRGTALEKEGQSKEPSKLYSYSLNQNYPNPFNPETMIRYTIEKPGLTRLRVYDINGQLLQELVNEMQEPGEYRVNYAPDKTNASGIYFYELISGSFRTVRKALFLK